MVNESMIVLYERIIKIIKVKHNGIMTLKLEFFVTRITFGHQIFNIFFLALLIGLKVPSGQIGSAREWYHWKAL